MTMVQVIARLADPVIRALEFAGPVSELLLRLWVAKVFWDSGVTKIHGWEGGLPQSTLMLFEYEYAVPLLSPVVAAYLGTLVELVFPVFLALGLGGRLAAAALFAFNVIAVISYPDLNQAGKLQHVLWGIMLLVPLLYGPGKLSVDHWIRRRFLR